MRCLSSVFILVAACGGGDPLEDAGTIPQWANSSSALGAYELVREPVALFDGAFEYADPACPIATTDDTTATIRGGCTDADDRTWTGTATVTRSGTRVTVALDDFGNDAFGGASRATGTVTIDELGPDEHAFEIDVTSHGGITTTVQYRGTVAGGYTGPTTWNGSGSVHKSGDFFEGGTVEVETIDQVRDNDRCPGEGWSGTTTMTSDDHVVVITYDGETACDPDHSARWSRDGKDQGVIAGISCSAGGPGGFGLVVVVCGVLVRRRQRRRFSTSR